MKQEAIFRRLFKNGLNIFVGSQRGQAVVEYVLLLVIIITLILGMRGVFNSMNTFMSDFLGEYIVCLMDYGELPSFGVTNSDLKQHEGGTGPKCDFRKFSGVTNYPGGANLSGGSTGSSGGSSGSGKNSSNGKNQSGDGSNSSKGSNGRNGMDKGSEASSGRGQSSLARSRESGRGASPYGNQINRFGASKNADSPADANDDKVKILEDTSAKKKDDRYGGSSNYGSNRSRPGGYGEGKYKAISGKLAEEFEKKSKFPVRKPTSKVVASGEGYQFVPLKKTLALPEAKVKEKEQQEEAFAFGNFLKWLIIAGIVIACFILFGGQIMNYSNSDS